MAVIKYFTVREEFEKILFKEKKAILVLRTENIKKLDEIIILEKKNGSLTGRALSTKVSDVDNGDDIDGMLMVSLDNIFFKTCKLMEGIET